MKLEEEKICFNCNNYFPYLADGPSSEGICLNDPVFDPYIDELLENQNYECCISLVLEKKFDGNDNVCDEFEMCECLSIYDEEFDLPADWEKIDLSDKGLNKILKNLEVDKYHDMLNDSDIEVQSKALDNLYGLMSFGNKAAIKLVCDYFEKIPTPITLEEVHHKINVLNKLKGTKMNDKILLHLIKDLKKTESNNTTRQWISEILKELQFNNKKEIVQRHLSKILHEKHFSYKMKNKIKEILNPSQSSWF